MGQPMGMFLSTKSNLPLVGPWLANPNAGLWMSWGGLFFDFLVVPALLWKRNESDRVSGSGCIPSHQLMSISYSCLSLVHDRGYDTLFRSQLA